MEIFKWIDRKEGKILVAWSINKYTPLIKFFYHPKQRIRAFDFYCGFRNKSYLIDEIKRYVTNINISTETGSEGHKGYVTDLFNPENYDVVLCCGPEVMMNKVIKMCNDKKVTLYVSMEKHMACGIGACLVCTCKTIIGNKRTCKDGPVFLGSEVIIDAWGKYMWN